MKIGKIQAICIFLVLIGTASVFGIDVKGKAPTFSSATPGLATEVNSKISAAFDEAVAGIDEQVGSIKSKPEKFIQAWGNSSVFASHGATQRAFGGYKLFAFTLGPMVGLQLPSSPFTIADELENITDKLNEDHDLGVGLNLQVMTGQISINTSNFLLDKLYLGLRFGYMSLDSLDLIDGFSFNSLSLGLVANYQLMPQKKLAAGFLLWRGLNLGTGFIYQGTNIGYKFKLDPITEDIGLVGFPTLENMQLQVDPSLSLDIDINTLTIPLEASTSVRLLGFLNFALGLGVDLGFGKSDMRVGLNGDINVTGNKNLIKQETPGYITTSAGGDMAPSFFNLKLMAGLGLSLGPVIIDIPVTWYIIDQGFNVGITLGVVW
jgi:hypothetical protein